MTEGKKDLWNVMDKKIECYGSKITTQLISTTDVNK